MKKPKSSALAFSSVQSDEAQTFRFLTGFFQNDVPSFGFMIKYERLLKAIKVEGSQWQQNVIITKS